MKRLLILLTISYLSVTGMQAQSWKVMGIGDNAITKIHSIVTDNQGVVYAAGEFKDSNGYQYVAKWDGTSWNEVGLGINSLKANNIIHSIAVDQNNNVYATGRFTNTAGYQYVAKWDGTSWTEVGTGVNALNARGQIFSMAIDQLGNIFVGGQFYNSSYTRYVAKWNGTHWGGVGSFSPNDDIMTITTDVTGNVYVGGVFTNASNKQYVEKWNGSSWSSLGNLNANGTICCITTDNAGAVYATGGFTNASGYKYIAKWNGTNWTELGLGSSTLNANGAPFSIVFDAFDNLYTGGSFEDNSYLVYVTKWDGTNWSRIDSSGIATLCTSAGIGAINALAIDPAGNIYAAGQFNRATDISDIAVWKSSYTITKINEGTQDNVKMNLYPNPLYSGEQLQLNQTIVVDEVRVINAQGNEIYNGNALPTLIIPGIYYVQITNKNQQRSIQKIVVQ